MNGWQELKTRFTRFFLWALETHPGKLLGTTAGLLFGILFILLGFWRALILMVFISVGFFVGKRYDDHKDLGSWLERFFH